MTFLKRWFSRGASKKKQARIERWLVELSDRLTSQGWEGHLGYDDWYRGDELAISLLAPEYLGWEANAERHCEFQVRRAPGAAMISLFAATPAALAGLVVATQGIHRSMRRIDTAKRSFFRRIERMVAALDASFDERGKGFPARPLAKLTGMLPDAGALVGLREQPRQKREGDDVELTTRMVREHPFRRIAQPSRRYQTCFAASVRVGRVFRAAPYSPGAGFTISGIGLSRLHDALANRPFTRVSDYAIANKVTNDEDPGWRGAWGRVADVASESLRDPWAGCSIVPDCLDLSDCDVCDALACIL